MADQKVTISITTLGNTAGADAVSKSLKNVSVSAGTLSDKVSVSTWGVYDLDKAVRKVNENVPKVPPAANDAGAATKKWGFLANQAGVQLGDFTTQVGMGTDAVRAFSMQAPQMLAMLSSAGVMGTKMALAMTGVGAAIPIITMAAPALMSFLTGTSEKADEAAGKVENLGEKLAEMAAQKTARILEDLDDAEQRAITLGTSTGIVRQAQEAAAKAQLSNAEKLAKAEENINVILGIRVDQFKQIREANARAERARQIELKSQRDAAAEEAKNLRVDLDAMNANKAGMEAQLAAERARMANLEKLRKVQYEKAGSLKADIANAPTAGEWQAVDEFSGTDVMNRQVAASEAKADLPRVEDLLSKLDQNLGKSESDIKSLEKRIAAKGTQIENKANELAQKTEAANINLDQLVVDQDVDRTLELSDTALKQNQIVSESLTDIRDELEKAAKEQGGLSMSAARALGLLNQTLANHRVDPNEVNMVRESMAQLLVSSEAARGVIIGGFSKLHQKNAELKAQLDALELRFRDVHRNQQ